jgi:hypothetical protein
MQLGVRADFLRPFIWSHVMDITVNVYDILCKSQKNCDGIPVTNRRAFGEESMVYMGVWMEKSRLALDQEEWDRWRTKTRWCSSFGQTANSAYFYDVLQWLHENVWRCNIWGFHGGGCEVCHLLGWFVKKTWASVLTIWTKNLPDTSLEHFNKTSLLGYT